MLLGELVPIGGGDPIPLLKDKLQVGRRPNCDIVLRFPNVSSYHCELELIEGHWLVTDLDSRNGTKVNGERVTRRWAFPGDQIGFAKHKFEIFYTAVGDAPPEVEGAESPEVFGQSLMEKAGLVRRKPKRAPLPPSSKPIKEVAMAASDSDESIALDWLSDVEED
ncbi:FHA domain-containing protein [Symmachiella dynata]|uniref:FHA domain-containing protein n=1 Tax=Symmachiella dynata TaxID=2527995 RepID=UPI00118D3078|nr:FHA domain-containing protein [Symmachiella dynata]QDT49949.1 FHA domain protein [Symmachiella dynata]